MVTVVACDRRIVTAEPGVLVIASGLALLKVVETGLPPRARPRLLPTVVIEAFMPLWLVAGDSSEKVTTQVPFAAMLPSEKPSELAPPVALTVPLLPPEQLMLALGDAASATLVRLMVELVRGTATALGLVMVREAAPVSP